MCAGSTPGTPAQQDAAAHLRPFEILGPFLDAHPAGHFAHRRQQRQPAVIVAERLVGHGDAARGQQRLGKLPVGGQMEIGEDDLSAPQQRDFAGLRLLDLDDHLGPAEDFLRADDHSAPWSM